MNLYIVDCLYNRLEYSKNIRQLLGLSTFVTPFCLDQFFWGKQIFSLGLGVEPISKNDLSCEKLTSAFKEIVENTERQKACRSMAKKIAKEGGCSLFSEHH